MRTAGKEDIRDCPWWCVLLDRHAVGGREEKMEESVKGSNQWAVSHGTFPISSFSLYWLSWTQSFKRERERGKKKTIVTSSWVFLQNLPECCLEPQICLWHFLSINISSYQPLICCPLNQDNYSFFMQSSLNQISLLINNKFNCNQQDSSKTRMDKSQRKMYIYLKTIFSKLPRTP